MPIEIRELQITTTLSDAPSLTNTSSQQTNTNDIVAQCVEQVLDILKQKEER